MALVNFACMNTGLPCALAGVQLLLEEGSEVPCSSCGELLVNQESVEAPDLPEPAEEDEEPIAQVTGPPYGGHSLLFADHDALPPPRPPRQRRQAPGGQGTAAPATGATPAAPATPPPPEVPRHYGGRRITGEPYGDNGHVRQLRVDLRRLGYFGPRTRAWAPEYFDLQSFVLSGGVTSVRGSGARPEFFDFHILGAVMCLKADLKFRYGLSDVPYTTPSRPENLQGVCASVAFCEGYPYSELNTLWKTLLPLNSPVTGNEAAVVRARTRQLDAVLRTLRARTNRRGTVVRASLPGIFNNLAGITIGQATPSFRNAQLQARADAVARSFIDGVLTSAKARVTEVTALHAALDGVLTEATTAATPRRGQVPYANADEARTLIGELYTAVPAWRNALITQLEAARPYLTELILLGSVDNAPAGTDGSTTTAMRIQQMLAGAVPGVSSPIFRVPRGDELAVIPETSERDVVVAFRSGSGRNLVITPNPASFPVLDGLAREAGAAQRVPLPILVSYVSHESGARHTDPYNENMVIYGVDYNNDRVDLVSVHRHDFDPLRGRPENHWAWSRGWGLGALTPTQQRGRGGAARSVFTATGAQSSVPFVRGLPQDPTVPGIIGNARENLAQTVRLLRYNYNHTPLAGRGGPRQCTFLHAETRQPTFDCPTCLRRFPLNTALLLQDDVFLSEEAYRALPEHAALRTRLGRDPTAEELQRERQEYPCSWLRALCAMVGGAPNNAQTTRNFTKHYASITGRVQTAPAAEADESAGEAALEGPAPLED